MAGALVPPDGLLTIRDFIRWGASRFSHAKLSLGHGTDNALDEARVIVLHCLQLPWDLPQDYLGSVLTQRERLEVTDLIDRRIDERKPAAYLTGQARFAGLAFTVDERVLVPRSPIAELIEQRFEPWLQASHVERVLDLCTGSGCIAIACAFAFGDALVDATDLSAEALEVAAENTAKYELEDRVQLIQSDLFSALGDQRYDLIVSNPPYVRRSEWENLAAEYHAEPKTGFYGGESGLDCVKRILREAGRWLSDRGILVMEVGSSAEALMQCYPNVSFLWLDFERGGDGVFLLTCEQLKSIDFS